MASQALVQLLSQVKTADNQLEQLKILVRGWRQLRSLDTAERKRLALTLGWDSAEALVERLGERGGLSPSQLLKAVRKAEQSQPGELWKIFSGLQTADERREALRRGLGLAEQVVGAIEPEQARQQPPPPPPPPGAQQAQPAAEVEEPTPLKSQPAEPEPLESDARPPGADEVSAPETEGPRFDAEKPQRRESAVKTETSAVQKHEPSGPDPWERQRQRFARSGTGAVPTGAIEFESRAGETGGGQLMRGFKALRGLPEGAPDEAALTMLGGFPDGWQRRRALSYLFRAGRISRAETAIEQIAALSGVSDRYWCASAWLEHRQEPIQDLSRLEPLLPPRWLARLQRRFSRTRHF